MSNNYLPLNHFLIAALFLLVSIPKSFSQDPELLSTFKINYFELYGEDVTETARKAKMAFIVYKRDGQLRLSRYSFETQTEIDGPLEQIDRVSVMESKKEEKWMLAGEFMWNMKSGVMEDVSRSLILLRSEGEEPLVLFFKTFKEDGFNPDSAYEAELVTGTEAWEELVQSWKANGERRDPPE